jgi:hypothetical protein
MRLSNSHPFVFSPHGPHCIHQTSSPPRVWLMKSTLVSDSVDANQLEACNRQDPWSLPNCTSKLSSFRTRWCASFSFSLCCREVQQIVWLAAFPRVRDFQWSFRGGRPDPPALPEFVPGSCADCCPGGQNATAHVFPSTYAPVLKPWFQISPRYV